MANAPKWAPGGEPLFDPPRNVQPISAVRGTMLLIDWRWLREHALFDAYAEALGKDRALLDATASEWVPFPLGLAHWEALDRLALPRETLYGMGVFMGEHAHNVVLSTLVRLAGKLGVSPFAALGQSHKLWTRSWNGGGMAAYRTGERAARVELFQASVLRTTAFRSGLPGVIVSGIAPFCKRPVVVEEMEARTPSSVSLRIGWQA